MKEPSNTSDRERREKDASIEGRKLPYQRPRIVSIEKLEAVAAICQGPGAKAEGCFSGNQRS